MAFRVKDANKSSLNTKAKIKSAFFKLVKKRESASNITVKELCAEAGIQRSTFYIHYKDIFDIEDSIISLFYEKIQSFVPDIVNCPKDVEIFYIQLFDFIESIEQDIQLIFRDREAPAIIEKAIGKISDSFGTALRRGGKKVNAARSIIVLGGIFAVLYEILNGSINLPLQSIKEEALACCESLFIKE